MIEREDEHGSKVDKSSKRTKIKKSRVLGPVKQDKEDMNSNKEM